MQTSSSPPSEAKRGGGGSRSETVGASAGGVIHSKAQRLWLTLISLDPQSHTTRKPHDGMMFRGQVLLKDGPQGRRDAARFARP
jgi:hypothetical protein